jgi:MerR family copper efflux transcriptional regulator
MNESFLTIKEAAMALGVSPLTLRNWDKNGKFPATRHPINNYRVYTSSQVEAFIQEIKSNRSTIKRETNQARKLSVLHLED